MATGGRAYDGSERGGHGFELQGDEGHRGNERNQRGQRRDLPRRWIARIDIKIAGVTHLRRGGIGIGEDETGETPGQRRLANAFGAAN